MRLERCTDFVSGIPECLTALARADWEVTPRPGRCLSTASLNGVEKNEDHVLLSDEDMMMAEVCKAEMEEAESLSRSGVDGGLQAFGGRS